MVFDPSRAHVARLAPAQVGDGADSIVGSVSAGSGAGTWWAAAGPNALTGAGLVWTGAGVPPPPRTADDQYQREPREHAGDASAQRGNRVLRDSLRSHLCWSDLRVVRDDLSTGGVVPVVAGTASDAAGSA